MRSMSKIQSMTGYGRARFCAGGLEFAVEIASVNQRGLSVSVSAPAEWMPAAERFLTPLVREYAARGKISISIKTGTAANSGEIFAWNEEATAQTLGQLAAAAARAGTDFSPNAEIYLRLAELHRVRQGAFPAFDAPDVAESVAAGTRAALEDFSQMRKREGECLEKDLRSRLDRLRALTEEIRKNSAGTVEAHRSALRSRLATLGVEIDLDDPRFLKEIAIFADRCDIAEELTRLGSHFSQFENCFAEAECGRKLDFICQEILRELNTIGSKANNAAVTRCVVEAKNEQERLREQVQNIE